jgi:hypothetical protein
MNIVFDSSIASVSIPQWIHYEILDIQYLIRNSIKLSLERQTTDDIMLEKSSYYIIKELVIESIDRFDTLLSSWLFEECILTESEQFFVNIELYNLYVFLHTHIQSQLFLYIE